ncbi:MAG: hypothetical protein L0H79_05100, partial [Intrasporangium sp.]|uniref:hypothetical protein n=1 Tax=Intrasporangium sp. TaxID=1925024 RepID=UPI002648C28A
MRLRSAAAISALLLVLGAADASAGEGETFVGGYSRGEGIRANIEDRDGIDNLRAGKDVKGKKLKDPWEYATSLACPQNLGPTDGVNE